MIRNHEITKIVTTNLFSEKFFSRTDFKKSLADIFAVNLFLWKLKLVSPQEANQVSLCEFILFYYFNLEFTI